MEIQYPHEQYPVYLSGENRIDDLRSMMCSGQGIHAGLDNVSSIIGEDGDLWKHILCDAAYTIDNLKRKSEMPIVNCNLCVIPKTYLCITKNGKFVISTAKKNEKNKIVWDNPDVILFFPYADSDTTDLLYEHNLIKEEQNNNTGPTIDCAVCNERFQYSEGYECYYDDPDGKLIENEAGLLGDWKKLGDKWYCPDCWDCVEIGLNGEEFEVIQTKDGKLFWDECRELSADEYANAKIIED